MNEEGGEEEEEEEARRLSCECDGQRWRRPGRTGLGSRDRLAEAATAGPSTSNFMRLRITTVSAAATDWTGLDYR